MNMAAPTILHQRTSRERLRLALSTGREHGQTSGSYVDDLAALGKVVSLCQGGCAHKFNALAYDYVTRENLPVANGMCDGCNNFGLNRLFFKRGSF